MILGIEKEINVFLQAILAGNFLYLIYKAIGVLRLLIRHRSFWISIEDLSYWAFVTVYVFFTIQKNCNGNIRWYFIMGLLGGSLMTHYFMRKITGKYIAKKKKTE